jgi:hypothetical protein
LQLRLLLLNTLLLGVAAGAVEMALALAVVVVGYCKGL